MDSHSYWKKQTSQSPLYPDLEWSRPEQRSQAGRLGIIGGNKLGFAGVAESYDTALKAGAGAVRVLLPDSLRRTIPTSMTDVVFATSNHSGSLARDALTDALALAEWSTCLLMPGDAGRNSETAILYYDVLHTYDGPVVLTRDAVDLLKHESEMLVNRPQTLIVISFAQLQKLFRSLYYPIMLTFSMQLLQLVEALHKFTITYPICIAVLHKDTLIVAEQGNVTTTTWDNPMAIWRGHTAAQAAVYYMWSPTKALQATTASLVSSRA